MKLGTIMVAAAVALAAFAAPAAAARRAPPRQTVGLGDTGISFRVPSGWTAAPKLAEKVAESFAKTAELSGQKVTTGGRAWTSPAAAGQGVLHVQWLVGDGETPAAAVPGLVRAELDDARERPRLNALPTTAFELVSWNEGAGLEVAWGEIEHRHTENETRTLARTSVFIDAKGRVHEIRVECVMSEPSQSEPSQSGPSQTRDGCVQAMTGLFGFSPALRPLGAIPGQGTLRVTGDNLVEPEEQNDAAARPDGGLELRTPRPGSAATLGPPSGGKIMRSPPPDAAPPEPAENRPLSRMLLVGGGIAVILALAFTMGRKPKP